MPFCGGLEDLGISVRGDKVIVGQTGMDLVGRSARGVVGSSPQLPCVREEYELICRHVIGAAEGRGKDLVDAVHVDEMVSALLV